MLEKAIEIAIKAHKGQTDKAGQPYILHLLRVMLAGKTKEEQICGVLHDIVEDTEWSFEDLQQAGFSETVVDALKCVTKTSENENYNHFIDRILSNPLAIRVKINDLTDNMDLSRLHTITDKDKLRLEKYKKAYNRLIEAK